MHKIKWPENINIELSQRTKMIDQLLESQPGVESIKKIIGEEWKKYHRDIRYTEANIKFSSDELEDILKKIEVEFLPSVTTKGYKIDSLGDGLRSLFYLSLVGSLLRIDKEANDDTEGAVFCNGSNVALTILEVEEPENHVSPHLMGKIIDNLSSIAQIGNAQIILTSHTPAIVKRVDPEAIRYLRINNDTYCSILNEIKLPPQKGEAYKYIKEAIWAYPEIYFARLVILGEGDSEEIVIPKVIQLLDTGLDASGISVVPLGGRHVNHFWKLLDSLDIPYVTLLDLDTERNGGAWGRIKYAITQLIKNGSNKDKLLRLENGNVLSDDSLNKMHKREINKVEINTWIKRLEEYDVFFSAPLDIDFMMLESFLDEYKMAIPKNGGPHIPNKITELDMYNEKLNKAVKATLKENGGNGETYTPEQKELMIWYNYFFLGRGKPSTHIIATSNIDKEKLQRNMPAPLKNLLAAVKRKLQDDPFSDISRG
jgi:predicted ATP-dependent endonuclease of OLD family